MNPSPLKPERAEPDPFANLASERVALRKSPKLPARTVLRRALAYFLFVSSIAVMGLGIWLLVEERETLGKLTIVAGFGMCGLAYVVYDWYLPYTIQDVLKKLAKAILRSMHG
jgi:hypothetical protein